MRVLRFWRLGFGASVALVAFAAFAADPAPPTYPECTRKASKDENEAAKNAHRVATQFYDRADYDKAIQYWNDAFRFDCSVNDLLINIANAYEKKGDRPATVATLEAYLKRTGPNPTVEEKVKNLKLLMAAAAPAADAGPAEPQPTVTAPPTATAPPTVTAPPTATAPPPAAEGPRPYGNSPWFLVGGGGALAIVGAVLLPIGYNGYNSANTVCPTHNNCTQATLSQGNTGRTEAIAGWGVLGVGVAAAAGGLVWQLAFNKPGPAAAPAAKTGGPRPQGVWVTPAAGPGRSGVVVGGAF